MLDPRQVAKNEMHGYRVLVGRTIGGSYRWQLRSLLFLLSPNLKCPK